MRFAASCAAGDEIHNSYGPKANEELLSTYGFAIRENPMDSVEIFVGQQQHDADAAAMTSTAAMSFCL